MKCPLCGMEYTREQSISACKSCPLHGKCNMMACPNCGYEVPESSPLIKKLFGIKKGE